MRLISVLAKSTVLDVLLWRSAVIFGGFEWSSPSPMFDDKERVFLAELVKDRLPLLGGTGIPINYLAFFFGSFNQLRLSLFFRFLWRRDDSSPRARI